MLELVCALTVAFFAMAVTIKLLRDKMKEQFSIFANTYRNLVQMDRLFGSLEDDGHEEVKKFAELDSAPNQVIAKFV